MTCKYKGICQCYSGWCDKPKQDYEQCVLNLIKKCENAENDLERCEDKLSQAQDTIRSIKRMCGN